MLLPHGINSWFLHVPLNVTEFENRDSRNCDIWLTDLDSTKKVIIPTCDCNRFYLCLELQTMLCLHLSFQCNDFWTKFFLIRTAMQWYPSKQKFSWVKSLHYTLGWRSWESERKFKKAPNGALHSKDSQSLMIFGLQIAFVSFCFWLFHVIFDLLVVLFIFLELWRENTF